MGGGRSHLIPFHPRRSGFVLRVDCARWGGTAQDLRHVALSAPHARTRERALALDEITQGSCATRVATRTGRHPQTVMGWVHAYNAQGPGTLAFRRTGGRPPFALRSQRRFRANGDHTIEVLQRLRAEAPDRTLIVLWDGAPYHRAQAVREIARTLDIELMPLEALWHWLREDVTYHHCHASAEDLTRRVADFEESLNQEPFVIADRLWVKDYLDPEEEKLRFSN